MIGKNLSQRLEVSIFMSKYTFEFKKKVVMSYLNGEGGNPYMFWERNNFNKFNETFELRVTGQYIVSYHIPSKTLDVRGTNNQHFSGHIEGIQDFFKAVEACGINKQWVI